MTQVALERAHASSVACEHEEALEREVAQYKGEVARLLVDNKRLLAQVGM